MNSMGVLIDADDIIAEIRMERQAFSGAFILVEGPTDARRFNKFIDERETSVVVCWGRSKLTAAIDILNDQGKDDFLGLADADFDRVIGRLNEVENLIYSEFHDFDIDAIQTDVIVRYFHEVADLPSCEQFGGVEHIREAIAIGLRPLSAAKLANELGDICHKLSDINWGPAFVGMSVNSERLAYIVLRKQAPQREDIERLVEIIDKHIECDVWQSTNGHDFSEAIGICLRSELGQRKYPQTTPDEIERHIRLALSDEDFRGMLAFKEINKWQQRTGRVLLKPHLRHVQISGGTAGETTLPELEPS